MSGIGKHLLLSITLLICMKGVVHGQFYETIRSGRPGQSIGASTVGQGIFQVQSGVDMFGYTNDTNGEKDHGYLTNTGVRMGITESFEVGAFYEYRSEWVSTNNTSSWHDGTSNMLIGLRHQISRGKGIIPSIGSQFRVRLPVLGNYYNIKNIAPSFILVTSQQLSKFTLITNLGSSWNGIDSTPTGLYTINLSCALTGTFGVFIENYGTIMQGNFQTRMDTGVAWLVTPNLQLDLLGGFGRNQGLKDYFISTGFSWRTHRAKGIGQK
jgi:hypothetical protein